VSDLIDLDAAAHTSGRHRGRHLRVAVSDSRSWRDDPDQTKQAERLVEEARATGKAGASVTFTFDKALRDEPGFSLMAR